jgi:bifunctional non-homologous end joining protein LigD
VSENKGILCYFVPSNNPTVKHYGKIEGGVKLTDFITPMMATLSDLPPFKHDDWLFEIKWDGYRAIAELNGDKTRFYSRNGLSYVKAYPKVFDELKKIKLKAVIDGEVVVLGANGMPSFQAIQNYKSTQKLPIQYYVFDCLSIDGQDMTKLPLINRKELLKEFLEENNIIRYCDHVEADGVSLFEHAKKVNIEGIIAKKVDSLYHPGKRTTDWLKIKNVNTDDFLIVGYTDPQASRQYFGSLMLAREVKGKLVYAGNVGTGFTAQSLKDLHNKLFPLTIRKSPLDVPIKEEKGMHWIEPVYSCQVQYTEITDEGLVRHPSFLGLRKDK